MPDDLLPPAVAAARLGVTTKTLRRWVLDGKLDAVMLPSGQVRYRADVIAAILDTTDKAAS